MKIKDMWWSQWNKAGIYSKEQLKEVDVTKIKNLKELLAFMDERFIFRVLDNEEDRKRFPISSKCMKK